MVTVMPTGIPETIPENQMGIRFTLGVTEPTAIVTGTTLRIAATTGSSIVAMIIERMTTIVVEEAMKTISIDENRCERVEVGTTDTTTIEEEDTAEGMIIGIWKNMVMIELDQIVTIHLMSIIVPIRPNGLDPKIGDQGVVALIDVGSVPETTITVTIMAGGKMMIISTKRTETSNNRKNQKNGHPPFKMMDLPSRSILVRPCFTNPCPISFTIQKANCITGTKSAPISVTTMRKIHPL